MSEKKQSLTLWDKVPFLQRIKNIKHIELIGVAIFVIILFVVYMSSNTSTDGVLVQEEFNVNEYTTNLENRLSNVLGEIVGVGKVSVMITCDGGMRYEYAKESEEITTSSSLTSGTNSKSTNNESVILINQNGKQVPLIIREYYPDINGVLVVCSGAKDIGVKLNIINAVSTLLSIDENKIQVLAGGK